ncbi:excisionase family DNA-binding protein [Streptomyces sp. 3214.6]|uniref:excisionase family DNA-binding protein n=1 Tax=Streptomyces sp. 3214.6 TaxID=1882757 RepID=UPI00090BCAB6|nr:excisionase family DNA-binding protein [Streptomyces sp. 3214.6]SHI23412.1 DNA binding domain-containing protein, excisionase family [Streptomyces sp. 3214.6]
MTDRLLNVAEVAVLLGTWEDSGERFPRRLVEERRIEYVKVGRYVRIRESVVEAYIAVNTVQPRRRVSALRGVAA